MALLLLLQFSDLLPGLRTVVRVAACVPARRGSENVARGLTRECVHDRSGGSDCGRALEIEKNVMDRLTDRLLAKCSCHSTSGH